MSLRPLLDGAPGGTGEEFLLGTLRLAVACGVSAFDLSAGARTVALQEMVGRLLRDPASDVLVLSPLSSDTARAPRQLLPADLTDARHRLGDRPIDLLWVRASMLVQPDLLPALEDAMERGLLRAWGVALSPGPSGSNDADTALAAGVPYFRLPYNLLDRAPAEEILERAADAGVISFVSDPHAQGLLDGSLLRTGPPSPGRPYDGAALARRFAPVQSLAFLTADRERTLPQAAVQFVAEARGVGCVLLDVTGPEQIPAMAGSLDRPPLGPALRARVPAPLDPGLGPSGGGPLPAPPRRTEAN